MLGQVDDRIAEIFLPGNIDTTLNALTAQAAQLEYLGNSGPGRSRARIAGYDAQISRYHTSLKPTLAYRPGSKFPPRQLSSATAVIPLDLLNL